MKKIVILDGFPLKQNDLNYDCVRELGEVTYYDRTPRNLTIERIGDAEIVVTNKVIIDKPVIDACPSIKYISVLATGYNIIDCAYARSKGIAVSNVPSYSTDSVVQHTLALVLEICANVGKYNREVHSGKWCVSPDFCYCSSPMTELAGKTFGIVGYGNIGKSVAKLMQDLGMKVIITNRTPYSNTVSMDEVLAKSDFLSLHCPLTEKNQGLINKDNIAKMKDGVVIINTARGGLINDNDVAEALKCGKIKAVGLDVLSEEPPKENNPLLDCDNCYVTPHVAWASVEARSRLLKVTVDNIKGYIFNQLINVVN